VSFDVAWAALEPAFRRGLVQAYQTLAAGGLAVGAVVTGPDGSIVAEGRNRAYDPPGGNDALQGTPLAHAEMNALAVARTEWDLGRYTLWSTQQPCAMCDAAAAFVSIGSVRYLAPDPWAVVADVSSGALAPTYGPGEPVWIIAANVMFLLAIASRAGAAHPTVAGGVARGSVAAQIVVELIDTARPAAVITLDRTVEQLLASLWDRITAGVAGNPRAW
jgi:tRNA(Arg) A34 adenosine deaminase TadA